MAKSTKNIKPLPLTAVGESGTPFAFNADGPTYCFIGMTDSTE